MKVPEVTYDGLCRMADGQSGKVVSTKARRIRLTIDAELSVQDAERYAAMIKEAVRFVRAREAEARREDS